MECSGSSVDQAEWTSSSLDVASETSDGIVKLNHLTVVVGGTADMECSESSDQAESTSLEEHTHLNSEAVDDADIISSQDAPSAEKEKREVLCGDLWHMIRLVVDSADVGRVVGKNGRHIRMVRSETHARIKILDGVPGNRKSTIMVTSQVTVDSVDAASGSIPPAADAILRIHHHLIGGIQSRNSGRSPGGARDTIATYLLIPANHIGFLIGQKGEAINAIRRKSRSKVRTFPLSADVHSKDRLVEIVGTAVGVHQALQLIVTHMVKLSVGRNIVVKLEAKGRRATAMTVNGYGAGAQSPPRWLRGSTNTNQAPPHKGEFQAKTSTGTVEGAEFDGYHVGSMKATRYISTIGDGGSEFEGHGTQTGSTPSPVLRFSPSSVSSNSPTNVYHSQIMQQHQETTLGSTMDLAVTGMCTVYPGLPCNFCTKPMPMATAPDQVHAVSPSIVHVGFTPQVPAKQPTRECLNSSGLGAPHMSLGQGFEFDPGYGFVEPAALNSSMVYYQYPFDINQCHIRPAAAQPGSPTWFLGPIDAYHFASATPNYTYPSMGSGSCGSYGYSPFATVSCQWIPSYPLASSYGGW